MGFGANERTQGPAQRHDDAFTELAVPGSERHGDRQANGEAGRIPAEEDRGRGVDAEQRARPE